jgi:hypothetical protein
MSTRKDIGSPSWPSGDFFVCTPIIITLPADARIFTAPFCFYYLAN